MCSIILAATDKAVSVEIFSLTFNLNDLNFEISYKNHLIELLPQTLCQLLNCCSGNAEPLVATFG